MTSSELNTKQINKPLLIYSASAGSGKTFRLVLTYLEILLQEYHQPRKFKSIVAMTFTNKAALEMKNRVIDGLFQIVNENGDSDKFSPELIKFLKISPNELKSRAAIAFKEILHNYEDFNVSTIDKFNLRLIRSFSRDLELSGDFDIILNEKDLLEEVIDLLMSKIGMPEEKSLTKLLHFYALSNLEDGEKWNFKDKLIDFAGIIGNEKYTDLISKLKEVDFSMSRFEKLKAEMKQMDLVMAKKCHDLFEYFNSLSLVPADLHEKSKSYSDFVKLGTIEKFPDFIKAKGSFLGKSIIKACIKNEEDAKFDLFLSRQLLELNTFYLEQLSHYELLSSYKSHFFNMALLQEISVSLDQLKKDQQIIRISDFNHLISSLVQGEEAPYIYERLGTRLQHFLLDEFQDTSRLQWLNLIPLLHESISNEKNNLIVGDPKQSIYRFNNGKAEQFVSLPGLYNPENHPSIQLKSHFFEAMGESRNLDTNYRSSKEIVSFNNTFFEKLKVHMTQKAATFYTSFKQKINSAHDGYVEINSRKNPLKIDELYDQIKEKIDECIADGYKLGDIAILSERNAQGNNIANFLMQNGYDVVSSDSLLIQHDLKIKLMISYLKRRLKPNNETEAKRFAEIYLRIKFDQEYLPKYLSFFNKDVISKGKTIKAFNDHDFLNTFFQDKSNFFCTYESVYDLMLQFVKKMNWVEEENSYVHHLLDFIYDFQLNNEADIRYFLDYYEIKKEKLALILPDTDRAITIMSIHKSKGLEFPIVILPFMNFDTSINSKSKFLVSIEDKILYTSLSKDSHIKGIQKTAHEELEMIRLDKINLLYVALTRAEHRLYGFNDQKGDNLGKVIHECLQLLDNNFSKNEDLIISRGQRGPKPIDQTKKKKEVKFFHPEPLSDRLWYPDIVFKKNREDYTSHSIKYGNALHLLISSLSENIEFNVVLKELISTGVIDEDFKERLKKDVEDFLHKASSLSLNTNVLTTLNEASILVDENITVRPDVIWVQSERVIIVEIKTGIAKSEHVTQLQTYKAAARNIFDKPLEGFLYYVGSQEFISV